MFGADRHELSGIHVGGGYAVVYPGVDGYHRLPGKNAAAKQIELARTDEQVDADGAPIILHELEHIGIGAAFTGRLYDDLGGSPVGQKTEAVAVTLVETHFVEKPVRHAGIVLDPGLGIFGAV